ncbi:DUF6365 family protein [Saccharopolyspora sp. WRP15-2]|uniref:DUF6365 family protein n=1 Tax=Saccharopolyspora oryzae TaxID=2997343 RepID=A0ABT4USQ0_9PSEU|nr:DUF6365 family protein [Saccharopolyspora oryzae]MDA3624728.1 DUF6365 family protein [Saccharopolyspora oryzae]
MTGEPVRLLVIAPVEREHHETAIGVALAVQLRAAGIESHFVVDRFNESQVRAAGLPHTLIDSSLGQAVQDRIAEVARHVRPTAVVLSDYFAHWLTFRYGYGIDPWFVADLGVPVIPIDLYELDEESRFEAEIMGRVVRIDDHLLRMPAHLRPVPTAHTSTAEHVFTYRATPTTSPLSPQERARVRARYGIGAEDPVLVVPTLEPQRTMADRAKGIVGELANRVPELVARYLRALPASTHLLIAGPRFDAFDALPADRTHVVTDGPPDLLVAASDAVWSFYFPAAGLEHALFTGVPGLLSVNGLQPGAHPGLKPAVRDWLAGFTAPVPRFTLWPWGWVRLLEPALRDNPFTSAFTTAELFDEDAVVGGLTALLYDSEARDAAAKARAAYLAEVDRLPDTADVVRAALLRAGASL